MSEPPEVALTDDRRSPAGARRRASVEGRPRGRGRLLFHGAQCGTHDITMMHMRADGPGGVEPHPVNDRSLLERGACALR